MNYRILAFIMAAPLCTHALVAVSDAAYSLRDMARTSMMPATKMGQIPYTIEEIESKINQHSQELEAISRSHPSAKADIAVALKHLKQALNEARIIKSYLDSAISKFTTEQTAANRAIQSAYSKVMEQEQ